MTQPHTMATITSLSPTHTHCCSGNATLSKASIVRPREHSRNPASHDGLLHFILVMDGQKTECKMEKCARRLVQRARLKRAQAPSLSEGPFCLQAANLSTNIHFGVYLYFIYIDSLIPVSTRLRHFLLKLYTMYLIISRLLCTFKQVWLL